MADLSIYTSHCVSRNTMDMSVCCETKILKILRTLLIHVQMSTMQCVNSVKLPFKGCHSQTLNLIFTLKSEKWKMMLARSPQ